MSLDHVDFEIKLYYLNYYIKQIDDVKDKYETFINDVVLLYPFFLPHLSLCLKMQGLADVSSDKLRLLRYRDALFSKSNNFAVIKRVDVEYVRRIGAELAELREICGISDKNASCNRIYGKMCVFEYSYSQYANSLNELFASKNGNQTMFIVERKIGPALRLLRGFCDYFENYKNIFLN
jgi:hypothetical protein